MVYAAPFEDEIRDYDETELVEIAWFTETDVAALKAERRLHADYELEAIQTLRRRLAGMSLHATAGAPRR